jgi:hypothetical protein
MKDVRNKFKEVVEWAIENENEKKVQNIEPVVNMMMEIHENEKKNWYFKLLHKLVMLRSGRFTVDDYIVEIEAKVEQD